MKIKITVSDKIGENKDIEFSVSRESEIQNKFLLILFLQALLNEAYAELQKKIEYNHKLIQ